MKKKLFPLLESYKASTQRTRNIFSALNIALLILLISFFNYRLSWQNNEASGAPKRYSIYELQYKYLDKASYLITWLDNKSIPYDSCKLKCAIKSIDFTYQIDTISCNCKKFLGVSPIEPASFAEDFKYLTIPIIGIKIYIQDLPLLGGFALSILLTWYVYARRREKSIVKKISGIILTQARKSQSTASKAPATEVIDQNTNDSQAPKRLRSTDPDLLDTVGIAYNNIFSTIPNIDDDEVIKFKKISISKSILYFLIFSPCILLFIVQCWDTYETVCRGPFDQKYLKLDGARGNIYIKGNAIDYFVNTFDIDYNKLENTEEYEANVKTWKYIDIVYDTPIYERKRCNAKIALCVFISLSFILIGYCFLQTYNIYIIRKDESQYMKEIYKVT